MRIDLRFLDDIQKAKFRSRISKLSRWYDQALKAYKHRDELPYNPTLFVTPFYVLVQSRVSGGKMVLRLIGLTSVDPDDPRNKWAIYIPYNVVKQAPKEINIANFAHEIAHFRLRAKGIEVFTREQLLEAIKEGKSLAELHRMKEQEVENVENEFNEPVRSMVLKMEKEKSESPNAARKYLGDAQAVPEDDFLKRVLGPQAAKKFLEEQIQKMKQRLGLTDDGLE